MPVDYSLFLNPSYGGLGITYSWLSRANNKNDVSQNQFYRFICLWTAFNAWGMCVTLADSDATIIKQLGENKDAKDVFERIILSNNEIVLSIASVQDSFPLPNFADLIRLDANYPWRGERNADFWKKIASAPSDKKVRVSQSMDHRNLKWKNTLDCMYRVRCNLVHGGKFANPGEEKFVGVFADVLDALMTSEPVNLLKLS